MKITIPVMLTLEIRDPRLKKTELKKIARAACEGAGTLINRHGEHTVSVKAKAP